LKKKEKRPCLSNHERSTMIVQEEETKKE